MRVYTKICRTLQKLVTNYVTSEAVAATAWHFLSENTRCPAAVRGPLGQSRSPMSRIMVQCWVHTIHRHFRCPGIPSKSHTWNYQKTWQCHANVTQVKLEIFSSKIHSEVYQNCHVEWIDAIKPVPLHQCLTEVREVGETSTSMAQNFYLDFENFYLDL